MNIRSLTRGDGVVIGAAVLLLIASFLDIYSIDGAGDSADIPNAWGSGPVLMSVTLAGIIGAALIVVARGLPQAPKVAGLDLGQFGVAFTVFAAWSALGNIFDPAGGFDNDGGLTSIGAGIGLILSLIGTLVLAGAAIATPLVPALKAPLLPAPKPAAPQPYGGQPQGGYGYPGAGAPQPGSPGSPSAVSRSRVSRTAPSPVSRSPVSRSRRRPRRPRRRSSPPGTSRRSGSRCRCRVRCSRRTVRRRRSPNWRRAPGTWPSSSAARA